MEGGGLGGVVWAEGDGSKEFTMKALPHTVCIDITCLSVTSPTCAALNPQQIWR